MVSSLQTRRFAVLGGLGLLILLAIAIAGRTPQAAAALRTPTDPAEVLETVIGGNDARTRQLRELRGALAIDPKNLRAALLLARIDIQLARERADPRFLGQAQAALAPWWVEDAPAPVLVLRATIEQSLHDFDSALRHLDGALRVAPDDPQAWLTRAVVLTVRARYDEARLSCGHVAPLAGELAFAVCETQIDSLTGKAAPAYARLTAALGEGRSNDEREWAVSSLGEYAVRYGDQKTAEEHFRDAMKLAPDDAYVRGALADLLLDIGRNAEVIALLAGKELDDGMLLRLALAEKRVNGPKGEEHREMLKARFDASHARGDVVHRREEARYRLYLEDDARGACDLAKANWDVQKEPWDARILLATAVAAHDREAAASVLAHLATWHLEDPTIANLAAGFK